MATSEPPTASPLVLLDGHSLAYRAFFALPSDLQTTTGQLTNVVYGFTTMLVKLFGDFSPDRIAVCFDLGRPAYRHDVYDGYKANRRTTPDDFSSQMPLVREVLAALRIPVVEVAGYEADDLIATLVREARDESLPVLVVTGDRDNLQLIDDEAEVRVMMTRRGITDTAIYDEAAVQERYGVPPGRYIDVAALRGDPSDNLPGVPGVGDKTATKLVQAYGTAEEVVAHADEQRGKLKENLLAHGEDVLRNKQLMRLRDDVPLPVGVRDLRMGAWDRAEIHRLFDTLEFHPLRERLFATTVDTGPVDTGFEVDARRLAKGELAAWLAGVPDGQPVALAARLRTSPGKAELTGAGLWAEKGGAVWLDLEGGAGPEDLEALAALLADPERPKLAHDAKYLYLAVWARGWELAGLAVDTALAAYLALPAQRTYDLADLALRYLRKELRPEGAGTDERPAGEGTQLALDTTGEDETWPDWCLRAQAVGELAVKLGEELAAMEVGRLVDDVELPLVPILAKLERTGIAVDLSVLDEIRDRLDSRLADYEARVYQLAGEEFNIGSNPQLQQILFEKLRLPKTKRIKTGYTTDHNALVQLASTDPHPILDALIGYREVAKLKNTYVDTLPKLVDKTDGRIHAQFNQLITSTGRLSTQNPNVQNIPIRTEAGREIRRAFIADPESEGLLVADYAQIEFRVLAHLAGDEALVAAFLGGEDVHATVAGMVWGLPPDQVDRDLRARVKMVTYGLAYGLSAYGLAQGIGIPPDEARALMDAYFERFAMVKAYLDAVVLQARRDGYTSTILGRRRYLPDLASDSRQRRQMAERMALNAPIQGSAADIIKMAMVAVDRAVTDQGLASRMVLQVHDELVFEVAPGEGERLAELVRREMQGVYQLRVPLEVSMATGRSWAEAQH
ncbi:MAG TPA: DNA polymerase I [Actinomycetes bacterium]|nr:DNA polymerase I [Actinomycetes bacterium]